MADAAPLAGLVQSRLAETVGAYKASLQGLIDAQEATAQHADALAARACASQRGRSRRRLTSHATPVLVGLRDHSTNATEAIIESYSRRLAVVRDKLATLATRMNKVERRFEAAAGVLNRKAELYRADRLSAAATAAGAPAASRADEEEEGRSSPPLPDAQPEAGDSDGAAAAPPSDSEPAAAAAGPGAGEPPATA